MRSQRFGFRYLLDNCTILSTTYEDTPLCEFCMESTLRRNEGTANFYRKIFFFLNIFSIKLDGPGPTSSGPEDSRTCRVDGEHLLICDLRRRVEEVPCSSGRPRTNFEANN